MPIESFRDLKVWQRAMDLAETIYRLTAQLPESERYGLSSQLRRAVVSVPSNIAEGYCRQSTGDYRHHLQIARASLGEIETQLLLAQRLHLVGNIEGALVEVADCSRMLASLIRSLRRYEQERRGTRSEA